MDRVKRGRSWAPARRFARVAVGAGLGLTLLGNGCGGGSPPGQSPIDGSGSDVGPSDGGTPDGDAGGGVLDEQALIYAVYAEFGDDRLPASVPRRPHDNPDSTIMLQVARRFPSLSAEAQAILDPFLRPPSDPDSWYATHELTDPTAPLAFDERAEAPNPRCSVLAQYQVKATQHTKIWYRTGDGRGEALATVLAAVAEKVYTDLTGLFGRVPPSDANATSKCNGGDAALDIYLVPFPADPASVRGRTIPYGSMCGATASFIELNMWADLDPRKVEALLAHEFFHTLQLGTYRFAAACDDYDWLGEATANWAIDHVFRDNQTEVRHAAGYMAGERTVPLDEPYTFADMDQTNGYADYVFFAYLTSKSSPAAMRTIWDATEGRDSVGATAAGMDAAGGAKEVWHRFALATWNDAAAGVQNDLALGDPGPPPLDWGLKKIFDLRDAGGTDGYPSTPVKLEGAPGKTFKLMQTAAGSNSPVALRRLSIHADYLKFMDDNVRSVIYVNVSPLVIRPDANLKIQALIKKGGSWGTPEDWTKVQFKSFCRDVTDERIEELVLIYSNSNPMRPSDPIIVDPPPQLSVSNVGCWRWQGTSSIEEQASGAGASSMSTASGLNLTFERWRPPEVPDGAPGNELFQLMSGTAYGDSTTVQGCTTTMMGSGPIPMGVASGSLDIGLGLDLGLGPPDRTVAGTGASSHLTHTVFTCPGGDPVVIDGEMSWGWMELPQLDEQVVEVRADGTIQGSYTRVFTVPLPGTRKMTWMLTPMRQ
jgi:hypothetical protein